MGRNIVVLGGNSHPDLVEKVCNILGIQPCERTLAKFSGGETRCEIHDSVRGKDVYIIQSGSGHVNNHFIDLCIMISALKTGSARRVTAVLPLFPYSRQPDLPYSKAGAPLAKPPPGVPRKDYTFESVPPTPGAGLPRSNTIGNGVNGTSNGTGVTNGVNGAEATNGINGINGVNGVNGLSHKLSATTIAENHTNGDVGYFNNPDLNASATNGNHRHTASASSNISFTTHDYENPNTLNAFKAKPGYKQWVAQAGNLVADLLMCAGADHVVALDLHSAQYQGFFDIPVDNLYAMPLLKRYIQQNIPGYRDAVVVSPDAGGAKRATAIADSLNIDFALIHKVTSPFSLMCS